MRESYQLIGRLDAGRLADWPAAGRLADWPAAGQRADWPAVVHGLGACATVSELHASGEKHLLHVRWMAIYMLVYVGRVHI